MSNELEVTETDGIETILFKVLVVGEPGVGKTSTVKRYVDGVFSTHYKSTIGVDFALKHIKWNDKLNIDLQLWDLAGQERVGTQVSVYFRDAMGAICLYDASREETKAQVAAWKQLLDSKVMHGSQHVNIPCVMLANKMDLMASDLYNIQVPEIGAMAEQLEFIGGFPVSSKANFGLDPAFQCLIGRMLQNYRIAQNAAATEQVLDSLIDLKGDLIGPPPAKRGWFSGWC